MGTKICSHCGEEKMLSEFHKDKTQKGGYAARCKLCRRSLYDTDYSRTKAKQNYLSKPHEHWNEKGKLYREKHFLTVELDGISSSSIDRLNKEWHEYIILENELA